MTNQDTCITRIPVALKERILSGHTICLIWRVLQLREDTPVLQTLAKVRKPFCVAFQQWLPSPITCAKPAMCTSSWHYMPWDITAYAIKQHNCVIAYTLQRFKRRQRKPNGIQQCKNFHTKLFLFMSHLSLSVCCFSLVCYFFFPWNTGFFLTYSKISLLLSHHNF